VEPLCERKCDNFPLANVHHRQAMWTKKNRAKKCVARKSLSDREEKFLIVFFDEEKFIAKVLGKILWHTWKTHEITTDTSRLVLMCKNCSEKLFFVTRNCGKHFCGIFWVALGWPGGKFLNIILYSFYKEILLFKKYWEMPVKFLARWSPFIFQ
jgi:hypothetical protein